MKLVAWFQITMGVAIAALWTVLLLTGQVPEVQQGRLDIWFHIGAELVMAVLLLAGGIALLRQAVRGRMLSALALGWLGYSALNSPGYYAQSGDWVIVGMFVLVVGAAAAAFVALCKRDAGVGGSSVPEGLSPAQPGVLSPEKPAAAGAGDRP